MLAALFSEGGNDTQVGDVLIEEEQVSPWLGFIDNMSIPISLNLLITANFYAFTSFLRGGTGTSLGLHAAFRITSCCFTLFVIFRN